MHWAKCKNLRPPHPVSYTHLDVYKRQVYFNVGKIGEDQLHDMAQRRGMDEKVLERLLAPNL